ncbi:DUF2334 domain-containing protein [bacterium]|nr:DUF2334 domain-containing protein [bacterium]
MPIHCLRYDDLCAYSDRALEAGLIDLLLRTRIPCTFGVIPFACDPASLLADGEVKLIPLTREKADLLKPLLAAGLAEVALHGYSHLALAPIRGHHEFSPRMPKETQRRLIRRGRDHLENLFGLQVRFFVPPWNYISPATIEILHEEGLLLSAGFTNQSPGIPHFPCTVAPTQTARALRMARRWGAGADGIGTLLHDYDFSESNLGISDLTLPMFEQMIRDWQQTPGVRFQLIADALREKPTDDAGRESENARLRNALRRSRLGRRLFPLAELVYWETTTAGRLAAKMKYLP